MDVPDLALHPRPEYLYVGDMIEFIPDRAWRYGVVLEVHRLATGKNSLEFGRTIHIQVKRKSTETGFSVYPAFDQEILNVVGRITLEQMLTSHDFRLRKAGLILANKQK